MTLRLSQTSPTPPLGFTPQIRKLSLDTPLPQTQALPVLPSSPEIQDSLQNRGLSLAQFDPSLANFGQAKVLGTVSASSVAERVLDKTYLLNALDRALNKQPGSPPSQLLTWAAPLISDMRMGGMGAPAAFSGSTQGKLDDLDLQSLNGFTSLLHGIESQIKAGKLPAANKQTALVQAVLQQLDPQNKLSEGTREALKTLLLNIPEDQLASAEIQGAGGAASGHGVTGSGSAGHYVNSVLTSLHQLNQTGRLSEAVVKNLSLLTDENRLHPELKSQKTSLLRSVLQDIAFPEKINQHAKATCAPTTIQILFAIKEPARYIELVANLASDEGKGIPDGSIVREPGTEKDDKSGRSLSNRLLQPALMEYGNGSQDYDNTTDKHNNSFSGLGIEGTAAIANKLLPAGKFKPVHFDQNNPPALINAVKAQVNQGNPISAGLLWGNDSHEILVTKLDAEKNLAYFMNPWGELQTLPLNEFQSRLICAALPEAIPGQKPALDSLPGAASQVENYKPLDPLRYRNLAQHISQEPNLAATFSPTEQTQIATKLLALKLPTQSLDYLTWAIKGCGMPKSAAPEITNRLLACNTPEQANTLLRLVNFAYLAKAQNTLDDTQLQAVLNSHPEKNLTTAQNEALVEALKKPDREKAISLITESLTQEIQGQSPEQRAAYLQTLFSPPEGSQKLALLAQPEKTLSPEDLGKLTGALAFGEGEGGSVVQDSLFKAYQNQWPQLPAPRALEVLKEALGASETALVEKLLKLAPEKTQTLAQSLIQNLNEQELNALPLDFAKNLRSLLGTVQSPSLDRLNKAIKAGEDEVRKFEQAQAATGAAPTSTAENDEAAKTSPIQAKDTAMQAWYSEIQGQISKLPLAKQGEARTQAILNQLDPEKKLPKETRLALTAFLKTLPPEKLAEAETQGLGGVESSGVGVTGSGKDGHYVNGLLTSLAQLSQTGRLNATLLKSLSALGDASKLHPDLQNQRDSLLRSVLQDIAFPDSINQHSRGTCAPTTVQIMLALKDPNQYVQMVTGLASLEGKGNPDGSIVREPGTEKDDKSGRSLASRLLQPAFMEYGNKELDYDNTSDKHSDGDSGLGIEGTALILQKLFPKEGYQGVSKDDAHPDALYHRVKDHVGHGNLISVGLSWGDSAHEVLLTQLDESKNLAYFINPWGALQTMPLDEFKKKLNMAALPEKPSTDQSALNQLPGEAARPEAYQALDPFKYRSTAEQFDSDPKLTGYFTPAQKQALEAKFEQLDLNFSDLKYIVSALRAKGSAPVNAQELVSRLQNCSTKDQAQKLLRLIGYAHNVDNKKMYGPEQLKNILDAFQGRNLTTAKLDEMVKALDKGQREKVRDILAERYTQALQNQPQDMRADLLNLLALPKDPEARKIAELVLKAKADQVLTPAELGKVAAGIAMNDFSEPVAELVTKAYLAQATQEKWGADKMGTLIQEFIKAGEPDISQQLFNHWASQAGTGASPLAVAILKGLEPEDLSSLSIEMLQDLKTALNKGPKDTLAQSQLERINQRIKEIEEIKASAT